MKFIERAKRTSFKLLAGTQPNFVHISQEGFCPCCDSQVIFSSSSTNLRERFHCSNCRCVPRERAIMSVIEETLPDWRKLAIHESSPATRGASVKLAREGLNYTPTQFFPGATPGTVIDGFRNEDLEAQTFGDSTLDLVVTLDVFEHVYDPAAAFREIARTLRPGGMHIFTTPLVNQHEPSEVWATRNPDGTPNFLHKPEWHGNPVDAQGSPVTMHWGFDIVDFIEQACGMETHIVRKYDLRRGLWAELNEVIVSKKS